MLTNILQYLEATAARLPDKIAFSDGCDSLTFAELQKAAKSIGSRLAARGFRREPVMIMMDRHPNVLSAFFGVVYAGCFYVPVDTEMPELRLRTTFNSLAPRIIISDRSNYQKAARLGQAEVLLFDGMRGFPPDEKLLSQIRENQIDTDPIYIVFTSGSTGVPKGVAACHRSVIDYTESFCEALGLSEDCVFGNQTPLHFDAPLKEIMTTIKYGATTYLIPKKLFLFPVPLVEYLNEHKINTICWVVSALCTISALGALDIARPRYLKKIAFGSEVFPVKQFNIWRDALPDAEFYNLYGPTECTGMSCWYKVEGRVPEGGTIPIGRPFRNTRIMLIDENGKEAAPGEPGEIYIAGTCVTLGYYNNPGKTDEAFVQNPLNRSYREIVYKTGDIARLNERGELVFISRRDSQIKHMGHRIELGEIEAAADSHERVARSCCLYDSENKKIVMYYTGEAGQGELLAYLKDYLPRYMLPAVIKKLDSLPLTPNGKLDRQALKELYKDSENEGTHKNLK